MPLESLGEVVAPTLAPAESVVVPRDMSFFLPHAAASRVSSSAAARAEVSVLVMVTLTRLG
jgi:hypothetical protein